MSTTFSVSSNDVMTEALGICGAYDITNQPGSADFSSIMLTLNVMIKAWIKTVPIWKVQTITLPLLTGNAIYQIGPYATGTGAMVTDKLFRIQYATVRNNSVPTQPYDTPIDIVSFQEMEMFGAKNSQGVVNTMCYHVLDDSPSVSSFIQVYPVPVDNFHQLRLISLIALNDVNVGTDILDFPQECYLALCWNLAKLIAFKYGVAMDRYREIKANAKEFYDDMADWAQENAESIRFMYDKRNGK